MKKSVLLLIIITIVFISCEPVRPFYTNFVKLNATISDTASTIRLGDTLKIKFTIPDTITAISSNGASQNVIVNTLQECFYVYSFYKVDTVTHTGERLFGIYTVISNGYGREGIIYVTNSAKPFSSTLNLTFPSKGLYYLQMTQQPVTVKINNSFEAGLAINFAVSNKHWAENAVYFNGLNQPDFITSVTRADADGYGFYCFRVN
jgi:sulfur relay (sulfurtransferase) DsrF/TusC family protein